MWRVDLWEQMVIRSSFKPFTSHSVIHPGHFEWWLQVLAGVCIAGIKLETWSSHPLKRGGAVSGVYSPIYYVQRHGTKDEPKAKSCPTRSCTCLSMSAASTIIDHRSAHCSCIHDVLNEGVQTWGLSGRMRLTCPHCTVRNTRSFPPVAANNWQLVKEFRVASYYHCLQSWCPWHRRSRGIPV